MRASSAGRLDSPRTVTADVKYAGYIERQRVEIDRQRRLAGRRIPPELDYADIRHLRAEAREQLDRVRPRDLGQMGRVRGITPADVAVVMVHLEGHSGDALRA